MKQKTFLFVIIISTLLAVSTGLHLRGKYPKVDEEKEILKRKLKTSKEIIAYLEEQIDTLETIVEVAYNSAVTFERLVGVKHPDGIVTYKEKCLITAEKMNRIKNYKTKSECLN